MISPELQSYVTAFHRKKIGRAPDGRYLDFVSAFAAKPFLHQEAVSELNVLNTLDRDLGGQLSHRDHEMHARRQALVEMLRKFDEEKP